MTQRILVVEDQEDNRRIIRDLLTSAGYELIEATDGEAGVRLAETERSLALVRQRAQVVVGVAELLVLGADAPLRLGLAAGFEVLDQLAAIGDRRALRLRRRGHAVLPALVA